MENEMLDEKMFLTGAIFSLLNNVACTTDELGYNHGTSFLYS
jgi:hypothetical protein